MSLFNVDQRMWKDSGIYMYQFVTMQESEIYVIEYWDQNWLWACVDLRRNICELGGVIMLPTKNG
jgi:hypothetical protein